MWMAEKGYSLPSNSRTNPICITHLVLKFRGNCAPILGGDVDVPNDGGDHARESFSKFVYRFVTVTNFPLAGFRMDCDEAPLVGIGELVLNSFVVMCDRAIEAS